MKYLSLALFTILLPLTTQAADGLFSTDVISSERKMDGDRLIISVPTKKIENINFLSGTLKKGKDQKYPYVITLSYLGDPPSGRDFIFIVSGEIYECGMEVASQQGITVTTLSLPFKSHESASTALKLLPSIFPIKEIKEEG